MIADRNLWAAVLVRAVIDASRPEEASDRRQRGPHRAIRRQALNWILDGGPDFRLVCEMAGLRPEKVQQVFNSGADVAQLIRDYREATRLENISNAQDL